MTKLDDAVAVEVMHWCIVNDAIDRNPWYYGPEPDGVRQMAVVEWRPSENDWQLWQVIGEALKDRNVIFSMGHNADGTVYANCIVVGGCLNGHAYPGTAKICRNKAVLRAALAWARAKR